MDYEAIHLSNAFRNSGTNIPVNPKGDAMQKPLALVFVTALVAYLLIVAAIPLTRADAATRVINVPANADIAKVVNADSGTTATAFQLAPNATYRVNALIVLKAGDELRGLAALHRRRLDRPTTPTPPRSSQTGPTSRAL